MRMRRANSSAADFMYAQSAAFEAEYIPPPRYGEKEAILDIRTALARESPFDFLEARTLRIEAEEATLTDMVSAKSEASNERAGANGPSPAECTNPPTAIP